MSGKVIVAMTGASGVGYGVRLLMGLSDLVEGKPEILLITNEGARSMLAREENVKPEDLNDYTDRHIDASEMDTREASGSNHFDGMVICPCTISTASRIACGIGDNLTTRLASVALKERRRLILAVRETPLSTPVLENLTKLSRDGVVIMPIAPPMYGEVKTVEDLQRNFAGRVMDLLGYDSDLTTRYEPESQ